MRLVPGTEVKIVDPRDPATGTAGAELLDSSVVRRGDRWWMYLAGQAAGYRPTELYSAALNAGAPLSATVWTITREPNGAAAPLAGRDGSAAWDGNRAVATVRRTCAAGIPRARAGSSGSTTPGRPRISGGPYTIGYVEWDGHRWVDQPAPVFCGAEEWERGSV